MSVTRRQLLSATGAGVIGAALPAAFTTPAHASIAASNVVLCTDYAVDPPGDPDDQYDVACAKALGIRKVVLDTPTKAAEAKLAEIGMYVVDEVAIRNADKVIVVGGCTKAWRNHEWGQRVIVFAGDAIPGYPEVNEQKDPDAYAALVAQHNTWRVPCFQGGWPNPGPRASYASTTDDVLTAGLPIRSWLYPQFSQWWGFRSLWAGPLLNLAFMSSWNGCTFDQDRIFVAGPDFNNSMVGGTRWLLARA